MRFLTTTLPNGLTIVGEVRDSAASSAMGFFVRTGSRDEEPAVSGVSHFLEHMMFKGTPKRSALEVSYALGAIGAQANAFTSEENTVYYMAVLPEYFADGFEVLSDMLRPSLDEAEFGTEKKVILEEIALYQDRPTHVLFEASMAEHFKGHPAGNSVLGTTQSISALSRAQMLCYFDDRYSAANIVLAAAGNFDWDGLVEMAHRYCAGWPNRPAPRTLMPHRPVNTHKLITKEDLQVAHCVLMAPGPAADDERRQALQVLSCILGDASGSKAYWKLVDTGLAESASVESDEMDGTGFIYGYVSSEPSRIDEVSEMLRQVMQEPLDFSADELDRAKTKLATRLVLQSESSMRRLMSIGLDWVYRRSYESVQEELAKLKALTRRDLEQAVDQFSFSPTTQVKLIPA